MRQSPANQLAGLLIFNVLENAIARAMFDKIPCRTLFRIREWLFELTIAWIDRRSYLQVFEVLPINLPVNASGTTLDSPEMILSNKSAQ